MGIQGVTRGFRRLQRVTRGYRRLQKTGFLTRTSPDTFSCLFSIKIKFEEIFNFWQKRWYEPCGQMTVLCVFETAVFDSPEGLFAI